MTRSRMRATSAALAVAAALVLAGCSSDSDDATSDESTPAQSETAAAPAADPDAPVEVADVTNLILETAQQTLEAQGMTVEVVDEAGAPVTAEDLTAFTVSAQDPAEGTVDPGTTVTLTVAPR